MGRAPLHIVVAIVIATAIAIAIAIAIIVPIASLSRPLICGSSRGL
jgi:hypothetical protein